MKRLLLFVPLTLVLLVLAAPSHACPFKHYAPNQHAPIVTHQVVNAPEPGTPVPVIPFVPGPGTPNVLVPAAHAPKFIRITTPDGRSEVFELVAPPKTGTPAPQARSATNPATPMPVPMPPVKPSGKALPKAE